MNSVTQVWQALPFPALVLDQDDRVVAANVPAEGFLNRSIKAMTGRPLDSFIDVDGTVAAATARVRENRAPLTYHDTSIRIGASSQVSCEVHFAGMDDQLLVLISPRTIAGRLDRADKSRTAARSAIGMAEMLAHEIKNPLAGIAGAAQLLSMNLSSDDLELTELIVAETRRIVKLLDQVEQFGNVRAPERRAVNLHDVLDRARKSAMVGFAAHMTIEEAYDPSLPA
ncbi:MAG: histidine kinase dimerization/phospho-acceptor domain-containing protein, partial [Pseudomonadota bacterium]